jgi:hypothetical protein
MGVLFAAVLASGCANMLRPDGASPGSNDGGGSGGRTATYDATTLSGEAQLGAADWTLLAQHRYFFGHQSVGTNLLQGFEALGQADERYRVTLQYAYQGLSDLKGPGLFDKGVGTNFQPYEKISGFDDQVRGELKVGDNVDIAFFKLCYVDISETTDVQALAQAYATEMNALQAAFPHTTFLWTTAPLTSASDAANVRRNQYAQAIRALASSSSRPLFDLAALEAVSADGSRCQFQSGGSTHDRLCPEWAAAAGDAHLNLTASQRFAKVLALGLIDVLKH